MSNAGGAKRLVALSLPSPVSSVVVAVLAVDVAVGDFFC